MPWMRITGRLCVCAAMAWCTPTSIGQQVQTEPLTACAAALECGLYPEAIVVAGASESTSTFLGRLESSVDLRLLLAQQRKALEDAMARYSLLLGHVGVEEDQLVQAQIVAATAVQNAKAALKSTQEQVFTAAVQGANESVVQRLVNWQAAATVNVPSAFRVLSKTSEQWREVEGALRSERRAVQLGSELDPLVEQILQTFRADVDVISAGLRLNQELAGVQAQFTACLPPTQEAH